MTCRTVMRWSIYPLSWCVLAGFYGAAQYGVLDYKMAWGLNAVTLVTFYMVSERLLPFEQRWAMTWASFKADLHFILTNLAFLGLLNAGLAFLTIELAGRADGWAAQLPFAVQLALCLLIFEAINYSLHRAMHEVPGHWGQFLWRVHAAHHLPEKLYVIMHAVFHPINAVFVQVLAITLPIWLVGYDQSVVTLFLMINGLHGLISHYNVDVRMGWLNYIFVGTELHRYHHSAEVSEAKNYGATLTIFDQLFGTFVYRPGKPPEALGVSTATGLPKHNEYLKVLRLPFSKNQT